MAYFEEKDLLIRDMTLEDAEYIAGEEIKQGWHVSIDQYFPRIKDAEEGKCIALVAIYKGVPAGYTNVYFKARGAYKNTQYPEIVDFGVLEKFRRNGIGSSLMDTAEKIAKKYSDTVCLGVGLHSGYGSAQRMYVKRGYIPDGSGVWYNDVICEPYSSCYNDDDLVLYFSKHLR